MKVSPELWQIDMSILICPFFMALKWTYRHGHIDMSFYFKQLWQIDMSIPICPVFMALKWTYRHGHIDMSFYFKQLWQIDISIPICPFRYVHYDMSIKSMNLTGHIDLALFNSYSYIIHQLI